MTYYDMNCIKSFMKIIVKKEGWMGQKLFLFKFGYNISHTANINTIYLDL